MDTLLDLLQLKGQKIDAFEIGLCFYSENQIIISKQPDGNYLVYENLEDSDQYRIFVEDNIIVDAMKC